MAGHLRAFLAEFVGTFALVFFAAGAVCADTLNPGRLGAVGIALAYGGAAAVMLFAFQPISGGHFNPALTLSLFVHRRVNTLKSVFYLAAQLLGAASAAGVLSAVFRSHPALAEAPPFLGACDLSQLGFKAGTLLEAIGTFFLVSAFYGTAIDERGSAKFAPIAAGLAYASGALVLGPLTGAALNPARAFGPAVATGHWTHAYVYWIGPLTGALAASSIYEKLYLEKK